MPCYRPILARRENGVVKLLGSVHEKRLLSQAGAFSLPCGRCVGCRLKYSQMWAIRCVHEASLFDSNCCVTLTYDDEHLVSGSLVYRDFQLFMKKLRRRVGPVRYFCGGEYGEKTRRPHFHSCLFGFDFPDKVVYKEREGKAYLWTSKMADALWGLGHVVVGECDYESAAYIARYMCDKVYGDAADAHYGGRVPEFAHMSTRGGGIGINWLRLYWRDVVRDLSVLSKGHRVPAPRFYLKKLKELGRFVQAREALDKRMKGLRVDNTPRRLQDKARVASARLGLSRRSI